MKPHKQTIHDLSTDEITRLAKLAVTEAVLSNLRAGIPVTGMVDGRVQTLTADHPVMAEFLRKHSHTRH